MLEDMEWPRLILEKVQTGGLRICFSLKKNKEVLDLSLCL